MGTEYCLHPLFSPFQMCWLGYGFSSLCYLGENSTFIMCVASIKRVGKVFVVSVCYTR